MDLAESVLAGNRLGLARLLTKIEDSDPVGLEALDNLFAFTGKAHLLGITGAPGTGKSSVVNQLAYTLRQLSIDPDNMNGVQGDLKIAIVAVDPSSPFTGGAILGDRVRMRDLSGDKNIFIRSMASRGSLGGLAKATTGIVQALDAAGFDLIMIETVGAGQAEVDIARLAHTTIVVEAPGFGDDIQAIKAGILEIADILVINKADKEGIEITERALRSMLQLAYPLEEELINHHGGRMRSSTYLSTSSNASIWVPPIHKTIATSGDGIIKLIRSIYDHLGYLKSSGEFNIRERNRLEAELNSLLQESLVVQWRTRVPQSDYKFVLDRVVNRDISPWKAVRELINE